MDLRFYPTVWQDLESAEPKLRAVAKVHLLRLRERRFDAIRVEKLGDGLWELKISWNKQEFRFLFFYGLEAANFVNFFQKKTRKTPSSEIALGVARMKEMQLDQAIGIHGVPH
jgi:phage-related protein